MKYTIGNLQGLGARARQEDSFTMANALNAEDIKNQGMLFAVCDGMGGMKDGKVASEKAVEIVREAFANMNRDDDISAQLKAWIECADNEVYKLLEGGGGSTAIVCVIYKDKLYYASVGDSFLYLKRRNSLIRINQEHTVCSEINLATIRNGRLDATDGREDPEAPALTKFVGVGNVKDIDGTYRPIILEPGDVILSCSDGVGAVLSEKEVTDALSSPNPEIMCRRLEEGIIKHDKPNQDNYTAFIVKCS